MSAIIFTDANGYALQSLEIEGNQYQYIREYDDRHKWISNILVTVTGPHSGDIKLHIGDENWESLKRSGKGYILRTENNHAPEVGAAGFVEVGLFEGVKQLHGAKLQIIPANLKLDEYKKMLSEIGDIAFLGSTNLHHS